MAASGDEATLLPSCNFQSSRLEDRDQLRMIAGPELCQRRLTTRLRCRRRYRWSRAEIGHAATRRQHQRRCDERNGFRTHSLSLRDESDLTVIAPLQNGLASVPSSE